MKVEFLQKFDKDLDKISDPSVKEAVIEIIQRVEKIKSISQIQNLKKLRGFKSAFRIRIGQYRIGIFIIGDTVEFARIAHRKDDLS